jgi:hypothetical protein
MQYSTVNFLTSTTVSLVDFARSQGHDIFWYDDKSTSPRTNGGALVSTLTLVPAYPADPRFVSRLSRDSAGESDIVLPALVLYSPTGPVRVETLGLGHNDSEWNRPLVVEGLASNKLEQMLLIDLLQDWLLSVPNKSLVATDYTTPSSPLPLAPMYVRDAVVMPVLVPEGFDAIQYLIRAEADLYYFE